MNLVNVKKGLVTKKFNQFFYVDILEDEKNLEHNRFLCKSRKNIKYQQKYIFVGDKVVLSEINYRDKTAVIENLLERKNIINRPAVANISDIYIIHSVDHPKLNYSQLNYRNQFYPQNTIYKVFPCQYSLHVTVQLYSH